MKNIKLLDVTLRDGGYKTNFHFSLETIRHVLTALDQAGLHYIEVGYRNGPFRITPDIGATGMCPRDYLEYCRKWIRDAKLTVMFHPRNIQKKDLEEMRDCGVDCVRICFPMQNPALGFQSIEMVKKMGFEFFTNITRMSQYSNEQIVSNVIELSKYNPSGIYFADSNGSVTPEKICRLFDSLKNKCQTPLGFHAHDNLFLAQANAVAAMECGAQFIDASLSGTGKGAGNLRTEGIVSFLQSQGIDKFDLCTLLVAAEYMRVQMQAAENDLYGKDVILGVFDLSQDDASALGNFCSIKDYYSRAEQYIQNSKTTNRLNNK